MGASNPLTVYLSGHFPEVSPMDFYRELFPSGSIAPAPGTIEPHCYQKGTYSPVLVRVWQDEDGVQHAERHMVMDDLVSLDSTLMIDSVISGGKVTDLLSPISYAGSSPRMDRAHELFALTFDLDYIQMECRDGTEWPIGLDELLYQMDELKRAPKPTFIVSSGTGLHLYYLLDKPLRMWPNVIERLSAFRHRLVDLVWNRYVTKEPDKPQYESVVQAFRMVGSRSRAGDQVVRAFRTGGRWSMEDLDAFVPEDCQVPREMMEAKHTLEEARRLWPEWDPEWRKKALTNPGPYNQWRVKRALFDWWCRRVEDGDTATEAFDGNRYWCIFVAACLAAKCPEVTYEELEEWAEKTSLAMPVNKRNGLKQVQHLYLARGRKKDMKAVGIPMKNPEGRPKGSGTKADMILRFAREHPDMNHSQIAHALGVSRPTVIKWLKVGPEIGNESKTQTRLLVPSVQTKTETKSGTRR